MNLAAIRVALKLRFTLGYGGASSKETLKVDKMHWNCNSGCIETAMHIVLQGHYFRRSTQSWYNALNRDSGCIETVIRVALKLQFTLGYRGTSSKETLKVDKMH
ncbi:hypothetical protein QYM36_018785 [Artemia franciscana]|uniref:Uncharacterized protein n=1 Tax=Artemia franciscana TaxID=6661 RepID=A0AA88HC65_ARTSF|nr:hypothetical protein QYM36_018785 [Artemia franciscana]